MLILNINKRNIIILIAINLLLVFPVAAKIFASENLIDDGFEQGIENWNKDDWGGGVATFAWDSTESFSGNYSARISNASPAGAAYNRRIEIEGGKSYSFSCYVKTNLRDLNKTYVMIRWQKPNNAWDEENFSILKIHEDPESNHWYNLSMEIVAPIQDAYCVIMLISMGHDQSGTSSWFDEVSLKKIDVANLLINGDFEQGTTNWNKDDWGGGVATFAWDNSESFSGNYSARISNAGPDGAAYVQRIKIENGKTYNFVGYIKTDLSDLNKTYVMIRWQTTNGDWDNDNLTILKAHEPPVPNQWYKLSADVMAPLGDAYCLIYLISIAHNTTNTSSWFDGVRLVEIDKLAPNPPAALEVMQNSDGKVMLSWQTPLPASDGDLPDYYNVYRSNLSGFTPRQELLLISDLRANTFVDMENNYYFPDKTLYYKVTSLDVAGNESDGTEVILKSSPEQAVGINLLKNADLEKINNNSPESWDIIVEGLNTAEVDNTQYASAFHSIKFTRAAQSGVYSALSQTVLVEGGKSYRLSALIKAEGVSPILTVWVFDQFNKPVAANIGNTIAPQGPDFQYSYLDMTLPQEAFKVEVRIELYNEVIAGEYWVDDIVFQEIVIDNEPPGEPAQIGISRDFDGTARLSWQKPLPASDGDEPILYAVYRSLDRNFVPGKNNRIAVIEALEFVDLDLKFDINNYYYRISAFDKVNNERICKSVVSTETYEVVSGKVIFKENQKSVSGAKIIVEEFAKEIIVDENGDFVLFLQEGQYTIGCSYPFHHCSNKTIEVVPGQSIALTFELEKSEVPIPSLTKPINNEAEMIGKVLFEWKKQDLCTKYVMQLSQDPSFAEDRTIQLETTDNKLEVDLSYEGKWYWRVRTFYTSEVSSDFCEPEEFIVINNRRYSKFTISYVYCYPQVYYVNKVDVGLTINFVLNKDATVDVALYDLTGKQILVIERERACIAGANKFTFPSYEIRKLRESGMYIVQVTANSGGNVVKAVGRVIVFR